MQFRLLGPVQIEVAGEPVPPLRRRERCLLGVLLLHPNQTVPVDRLAELLWDGDPPARARRTIHSHISRLRAVLTSARHGDGDDDGDDGDRYRVTLATVGSGYQLDVDPQAVDAHRFRTLLHQASQTSELPARVERLRAALDLWRGMALDNAASEWLRDRLCADLAEQRLAATEELVSASLVLGREREVLPELARSATAYPGRENLVALHMQALYQVGRKAEALEVYRRARAYLAGELGLEPGSKLRELHQQILRDQLPATAAPAPAVTPGTAAASGAATASTGAVPRQLPADVASFAGRTSYLAQLDALLPDPDQPPASVVIGVIGGTAGVGKTSLAVHWAHRVADRFPDGQLYVNLHGYAPGRPPMEPAEAVRGFLDAFHVPAEQVPVSLAAQAGRYRSLLAGRRVLVVLDNAADAEQVRPLLPGTPGCLVLVTSRSRLSSLVAAEGAHPVTLDLLPAAEARELLAGRLGADRVAAEPEAVADIVARCARLPLALAVAAARAAAHPGFPLRVLADRLCQADGGLDEWSDPDTVTDVRAVLSWSYRALGADAARLFRLLGLHPGPDLSVPAAASLAGTDPLRAGQLLAELARAHLVTEHRPGRYAAHDLLRAYAAELARTAEPRHRSQQARHRILDYYLHTAVRATTWLSPHRSPISLPAPQPGATPDPVGDLRQALAWFADEHPVLRAAVAEADRTGFETHCWQLAWALSAYTGRLGRWRDYLATQQVALAAARRRDDPAGQAHVSRLLGVACARLGRPEEAHDHLDAALRRFSALVDHANQAVTHTNLGMVCDQQGRYRDALAHTQQALELYRVTGNRLAQAGALNNLGVVHGLLGEHQRAVGYCQQALALYQEVGSPEGRAGAWDSLGQAHHQLGDYREAIACYRHALAGYRDADHPLNQAAVLTNLGDTLLAAGEPEAARTRWQAALELFERLDHADAGAVRARLAALGAGPGPPTDGPGGPPVGVAPAA